MNTPMERLQTALETLGLKAVQARLENLLEQASKKEPSYGATTSITGARRTTAVSGSSIGRSVRSGGNGSVDALVETG
jgi:hypothetical protein